MDTVEERKDTEELRLSALRDQHILDTPEEEEFNNLAALAAHICEAPLAQINFIDTDRLWSKAKYGLDEVELPRSATFCHYTIQQDEHMVVHDASKDERFSSFPFVEDEPGIRFYAGFNIKGQEGLNLGTICVLDVAPRNLSDAQFLALNTLSKEIEARLELRQKTRQLETITAFLESSVDMMMIVEPETGRVERFSDKVGSFFGLSEKDSSVLTLEDLFPDDAFVETVREWEEEGAKGKIKPIVHVIDLQGREVFLETNVEKRFEKWFIAVRNVTEEVNYQHRLEKFLDEKNVLLGEIHHRVKNNLAVISGILQLEELNAASEEVRQSLYNNYMRVNSMALIHEEMYRENDFTDIRFDEYLTSFVKTMIGNKRQEGKQIEIRTSLQPVLLNLNQAVPCALIVNELVSNAYEYAFEGRTEGYIKIQLELSDSTVRLSVKDNGIGLPEDFDLTNSPTLGTTLIYSYSEQLESTLDIKSEQGSEFTLSFKQDGQKTGSSASQNFSLSA
jgi:two-component sensor histidine kinase